MIGENFVILSGTLRYKSLKEYSGYKKFSAKIAMPVSDDEYSGDNQYLKVSAWGTLAERLDALHSSTFVKIHGHIEERSYKSNCKHCRAPETKYWTEVVIDNFKEIGD